MFVPKILNQRWHRHDYGSYFIAAAGVYHLFENAQEIIQRNSGFMIIFWRFYNFRPIVVAVVSARFENRKVAHDSFFYVPFQFSFGFCDNISEHALVVQFKVQGFLRQ